MTDIDPKPLLTALSKIAIGDARNGLPMAREKSQNIARVALVAADWDWARDAPNDPPTRQLDGFGRPVDPTAPVEEPEI